MLRRVVGGEIVEVTDHGHPIARTVPFLPRTLDQLVLDGRASEAEGALLPTELRSLGAIHLAAALAVGSDLGAFVTYDERLAAARTLGLVVETPR